MFAGATADILCPCALGGLLTEDVVPDLHCAIIVGAANNQLASAQVADSLAAAGILYVPDFLANAGGIINIAEEAHGYDRARAAKAVGQIRNTTTTVLERAEARGITPLAAAEDLVAERLAGATDGLDHFIESSAGANRRNQVTREERNRRSQAAMRSFIVATWPARYSDWTDHTLECRRRFTRRSASPCFSSNCPFPRPRSAPMPCMFRPPNTDASHVPGTSRHHH